IASHRDGETDARAGGDKARQKRAPPPSCFVACPSPLVLCCLPVVHLYKRVSLFSSASNMGVEPGQFKPVRKRLKATEYENLDHCLLVWFNQARAFNTPISGPVLFEKGAELAQELGLTDFKMDRG
ncbi:tigger transposable element-derived protein 4, partial [Elysia marginata]